jgi:ankyrin repeat protein
MIASAARVAILLIASGMTAMAQDDRPARLRAAAASGNTAEITTLLAAGTAIDAVDSQGRSALLLAVDANQTTTAEALLDAGASPNIQAANHDTPWLLAGAQGRTAILAAMIPRAPDLTIRNRYGGNALIPACERGHVETVALLLQTAIPVDHINRLGWTCLLEIVLLGDGGPRHQDIARMVLAAGANPNLADREGVTPLAHAVARNQPEIAAMIRAAGGRMEPR